MDILIPTDPNDYALIDTFNRAGNLNLSAATYNKFGTGLWAETTAGEFLTNVAGYVTRKAAAGGNDIGGANVFAGPKKVSYTIFGGTDSRARIHIRKTSSNVLRTSASMNSIEVKTVNDGAGAIDSAINIIVGGVITEILTEGPHSSDDATGTYHCLIEDTGTEIKLTVNGVTRSVTLPDPTLFETNDFIGINMRDNTELLSQLRVW